MIVECRRKFCDSIYVLENLKQYDVKLPKSLPSLPWGSKSRLPQHIFVREMYFKQRPAYMPYVLVHLKKITY